MVGLTAKGFDNDRKPGPAFIVNCKQRALAYMNREASVKMKGNAKRKPIRTLSQYISLETESLKFRKNCIFFLINHE